MVLHTNNNHRRGRPTPLTETPFSEEARSQAASPSPHPPPTDHTVSQHLRNRISVRRLSGEGEEDASRRVQVRPVCVSVCVCLCFCSHLRHCYLLSSLPPPPAAEAASSVAASATTVEVLAAHLTHVDAASAEVTAVHPSLSALLFKPAKARYKAQRSARYPRCWPQRKRKKLPLQLHRRWWCSVSTQQSVVIAKRVVVFLI